MPYETGIDMRGYVPAHFKIAKQHGVRVLKGVFVKRTIKSLRFRALNEHTERIRFAYTALLKRRQMGVVVAPAIKDPAGLVDKVLKQRLY